MCVFDRVCELFDIALCVCVWCAIILCCNVKVLLLFIVHCLFFIFATLHHKTNFLVDTRKGVFRQYIFYFWFWLLTKLIVTLITHCTLIIQTVRAPAQCCDYSDLSGYVIYVDLALRPNNPMKRTPAVTEYVQCWHAVIATWMMRWCYDRSCVLMLIQLVEADLSSAVGLFAQLSFVTQTSPNWCNLRFWSRAVTNFTTVRLTRHL